MPSPIQQIIRRFRYGQPIVVVSGLPRSGTSMAMRMLAVGGMPILTDAIREPDESNPRGYYEFEPVKDLHRQGDAPWLAEARGKAVKIVSFLLTWLPEAYDYRVIFMQRDLREVIASETAMLRRRGEAVTASPGHTLQIYQQHLTKVERFLDTRRCFTTLRLDYREVLDAPAVAAARMRDFVGRRLDVAEMARVAEPALYRNRATPG